MNHFQNFISFFLILVAMVCILSMLAGFFLAIGMNIAEVFITIVVKPPHLWGGYKTAIQRIL